MAARQDHISHTTPMGGTLVPGGATFRTWAPKAREVYVLGDFNNWTRDEDALLVKQSDDRWTGSFRMPPTA
jgi:1,4-alpha-glucan branching enzyme